MNLVAVTRTVRSIPSSGIATLTGTAWFHNTSRVCGLLTTSARGYRTAGHVASGDAVDVLDGRFVLFDFVLAALSSGDTNGFQDVYLRDRDADGDGIFDEPGAVTLTVVSRGTGNLQATVGAAPVFYYARPASSCSV